MLDNANYLLPEKKPFYHLETYTEVLQRFLFYLSVAVDSCDYRAPFFSVVVIGSFTLCYLPGFIGGVLTVKLGPSRIPNAFRSSGIVLMAINSALNPIIYMFRSNEFRIAFKKLFRGASIAPLPIEGKKKARAGRTSLEVSTCNQLGRQPSFLTVSTEDVKALTCRMPASSEIAVAVTVDLP